MAALLILIATLLTPTHADDPVVLRMERVADPAYVRAIDRALTVVDPEGDHPEWRGELWRICKRESWCGRFGPVKVHAIDGWVGVGSWAHAVTRGRLDPERCPEHRLTDYTPISRYLARFDGRPRYAALAERIADTPTGDRKPTDFATRGGFGQNAARALRLLPGTCTPPEAMDDPANAALAAAKTIAACERWDGPEGHRYRRPCTCGDHARLWTGAKRFDDRTLYGQWRTVRRQCGGDLAVEFVYDRATAFVVGLLSTKITT